MGVIGDKYAFLFAFVVFLHLLENLPQPLFIFLISSAKAGKDKPVGQTVFPADI
jgi:hypothetical protein